MKFRTSLLLAALAIMACGTVASAFPVTITQTLYYESTAGATGNAGGAPDYTCTSSGVPCTGLLNGTWNAIYGFNGYLSYGTGVGAFSVTAQIIDHFAGNLTVSQTSGNTGFYAYEFGGLNYFSLTSPAGVSPFLTDQQSEGNSAVSVGGACSGTGTFVSGTNTFDSTGCVEVLNGGSNGVNLTGFKNDTLSPVGLGSANFNTSSAVDIYELAAGTGGADGVSPIVTGGKTAIGSEIILTYTYDNGIHTATPEPATLLLLGSALSFLGAKLRRRAVK